MDTPLGMYDDNLDDDRTVAEAVEDRLLADFLDEWLGDEDFGPTFEVLGPDASDEARRLSREDHANTLLWRIRRAERELARIEKHADFRRQRIQRWVDDFSKGPKHVIADALRQLEDIARQVLGPEETSFTVPSGRVGLKKPPVARLVIDDETAALAYLRTKIDEGNCPPEAIRLIPEREEISKDVVKSWALTPVLGADGRSAVVLDEETGEQLPGAHFEGETARVFNYKTADR